MSKDIKAKDLSYKAAQSVVEHGSIPLATLKEAISMQEKMDELLAKEIEFPEQEPFPEIPSFPEEVSISNLPDIQKVEVINPSDFSGLQKAIESIEMPKHGELIEESNAVLGAILEALQVEEKGSEKVEVTNLSEVVASLEKIENTIKKIPEADYKALAKIVKDNLNINVSGGSNGIIRNKGDQQINPATEEKQNEIIEAITNSGGGGSTGGSTEATLSEVATKLGTVIALLKPLAIITNGSNRLNIDVNNITTLPTLAAVTTVSTVSNLTNIGGLGGFELQYNAGRTALGAAIRNNI